MSNNKQCSVCKENKNLNMFYSFNTNTQKKYYSACKECRKQYDKKKKGTKTLWISNALDNSKRRAKTKGLEHSITRAWVLANIPDTCPVLGIKLECGSTLHDVPSLDRVDNSKGYTEDNVRIISNRANRLKSDATLEELKAIIKYMENI